VEKTDNQPTAESLPSSTKRGRKPTSKTNALTPDLALEILQEAVNRCQQSGVSVGVERFFDAGTRGVVIILEGVDLVDGNMVLHSEHE
jgi:D-Tyr-tRNAtyr deacylase